MARIGATSRVNCIIGAIRVIRGWSQRLPAKPPTCAGPWGLANLGPRLPLASRPRLPKVLARRAAIFTRLMNRYNAWNSRWRGLHAAAERNQDFRHGPG